MIKVTNASINTPAMVIIMTAEEESSKVVTTVPVKIQEKVLEVNLRIHFFAFSPIAFWMVSERLLTANKIALNPQVLKVLFLSS